MSVQDIVNLQITLRDSAPTKQGFGRPAFSAYHTHYSDLSRLYRQPAELLDDGFLVTDKVYLDAQALCSQRPRPKDFKVLRLGTPSTQTVEYTPIPRGASATFIVGDVYSGVIGGNAWSFTVPSSPSLDIVVDGITSAIDALPLVTALSSPATTSSVKTVVTTTAAGSVLVHSYSSNLQLEVVTTDAGIAADLAACFAVDSDWFALLPTGCGSAEITAIAAWIEPLRRMCFYTTSDNSAKGASTGIFHSLKALAYANTAGFWHHILGAPLAAAITGQRLTAQPGSDTWAHKTVVGVAPSTPDYLSTSQQNNVLANNGSIYTDIGGSGRIQYGKTAGGSRIDTIRYIHFLFARVQEAVLGVFQSVEKVPFTDEGVGMLTGAISAVLFGHTKAPYFALKVDPPPFVEAPLVADVDLADRVDRHLPDVTFSATLTGAIETIDISGTVSV
jgi:hypothetical protein